VDASYFEAQWLEMQHNLEKYSWLTLGITTVFPFCLAFVVFKSKRQYPDPDTRSAGGLVFLSVIY
jgi:hypothetical protein